MSPTLLKMLRNHEYWRLVWSGDPAYRGTTALRMVHEALPGARKLRGHRNGKRGRPITYDTIHFLANDKPETVI